MTETIQDSENKVWECKIGAAEGLPLAADHPMREAVARAYLELTGKEPNFVFSGWGGSLTEGEQEVVYGKPLIA